MSETCAKCRWIFNLKAITGPENELRCDRHRIECDGCRRYFDPGEVKEARDRDGNNTGLFLCVDCDTPKQIEELLKG